MARLTGVSYVVLAMLARRPTSAYDLTQDIKTSMSQCMPRSSTLLYKEPKNLVAHGLAEVETQMKGRQKRAVYSITDAGRVALAEWFAQTPAPPIFESEAIVRLVFGHVGERADLIAALAALEEQVQALTRSNLAGFAGWFGRNPPTPEHLADLTLLSRLYVDMYALLTEWSRTARAEVAARPEEWPEDAVARGLVALQDVLGEAGPPTQF
jgi:DNA-binding PadR family transcriptional regulator